MKPIEFHELAVELSEHARPAALRTGISRSYYACFHSANQMLREMAVAVSRGPAAHGEIRRYLLNSGNAHLIQAGNELGVLHSMRLKADYDLNDASTEESGTAQFSIQKAAGFIAICEACRKEPTKSRVAAGITAYLRKLQP